MRRTLLLLILILVPALLSTACSPIDSPDSPTTTGRYEIDPLFWSYYNRSGGSDRFGPAISTLFTNEAGERLQYVENALLVYNPHENRFYFAPLGVDFNVQEPPTNSQPPAGSLVIDGYLVHPALVDTYLDLGREIVGAPLSNPYYNYAKNRLEQHFENLGLYYLLDDPAQTTRLLAYGLVHCGDRCPASLLMIPDDGFDLPLDDSRIEEFITAQGLPKNLLGDVVKQPAILDDGTWIVIFDHMALSAASENGEISFVPITHILGYSKPELFSPINSPILTFIPIRENTGHNVLNEFLAFINANGGYAACGIPTTELFSPDPAADIIRQCFTYLCLDYYPNAIEAKVRPAALGEGYLNRIAHRIIETNPDPTPLPPQPKSVFNLAVWESHNTINSFTPQSILVTVLSNGRGQPGQNLELYLSNPDGNEQLYYLPTTNENGRTGITLEPIAGENGDMVEYQVCLTIEAQPSICVRQSFMIWGNP